MDGDVGVDIEVGTTGTEDEPLYMPKDSDKAGLSTWI
jgi:hypothetical protein